MRKLRISGLVPLTFAALMASAPTMRADSLTGALAGMVSNTLGIPQMGATVTLYNQFERQVARAYTNDRGAFQFESLPSGVYSIRVSLAAFMPALHNNIGIQPGLRRVLNVHLASALSSIELVYSLPLTQGLMHDDWKWALRSATGLRPILRFAAANAVREASDPLREVRTGSAMFSHTRGMLKLSAGDSTAAPTLGSQPDLGTAFALATSFLGTNNLQFSGNFGYSADSGSPAAGFRTIYSRQLGENRTPEVAVTMRQMFLAGRVHSMIGTGRSEGAPMLRTLSVGVNDQVQITDNVLIRYGGTLDSVSFINRLNYFSPFAMVSYTLQDIGTVDFAFSSGLPNARLYSEQGQEHQQALSGVALFPRVSVRDGRAHVQRSGNIEVGFKKTMGSRTLSAAVYRESTANAALMAADADGAFAASDLLPDMFSTASVINAGRFESSGYMVALKQHLGDDWSLSVAYGNSGVLQAERDTLTTDTAAELRSSISQERRHWVHTRLAGLLPTTGTRFTTSYQFLDGRVLTPGHFYMTERTNPELGLNVSVRQPLPTFGMMSGKLEATADIRNILAQGYQPMTLGGGRRMTLVHTPRALRGGLAFIF